MSCYYYSSDKQNWSGGVSFYSLMVKLMKKEIGEDTYIWHPGLCPNKVTNPNECDHIDNAKKICEMDLFPSWLSQDEGEIDHYDPEVYSGTQPIRVVNPMLIYMFQNTHPLFLKELEIEINDKGLNKKLNLVFGEEAIRNQKKIKTTPYVDTSKTINLHETFLSYAWCVTYTIYTLFLETVDYPTINQNLGYEKYPVNQGNIDEALELFNYAKSLIIHFTPWDKDQLPNPEKYSLEGNRRNYIEQTTTVYTEAIKFILCHEFTHAKNHIDKLDDPNLEASHFLDFEKEADDYAIDLMKKGMIPGLNQEASEMGIVIALLLIFFFRHYTISKKHPNSEDRLTTALEKLNLPDSHVAWGMACIGLKLWDEQFNLNFDWSKELPYKELYYKIVQQIKDQNSNG